MMGIRVFENGWSVRIGPAYFRWFRGVGGRYKSVFAGIFLFAFPVPTNEPFTCFGRRKMYGIEHKKAPGTAGTVPGAG